MENRFGAPASGTPEWSARREFELLLLLGGSRKAAVQLWLRKQRQRVMWGGAPPGSTANAVESPSGCALYAEPLAG